MQKTFDLRGPAGAHIAIEGGSVDIETIDGTEARVEVMRDRGGEPGGDLHVDMRETPEGPELVIELSRGGGGGFLGHFGKDRDLVVRVQLPHGSRLRVSTASADVAAMGSYSRAWLHTASGDIRVGRVQGDLEIKTASGDFEAELVAGNLTATAASGDARLRRTEGDVTLRSASGDVELREVAGRRVEVTTASGDVEIRQVEQASVSVKSASGDITIGVRRGTRVWLDVRSLSGETDSEIEMTDASGAEEGPLVEIRAMTMSGDIQVRRAEAVVI